MVMCMRRKTTFIFALLKRIASSPGSTPQLFSHYTVQEKLGSGAWEQRYSFVLLEFEAKCFHSCQSMCDPEDNAVDALQPPDLHIKFAVEDAKLF